VEGGRVIVTGASSGIGEATAQHLRSLGFEVVPGVRKEEDTERLRGEGFQPLILDVADSQSIERCRGEVGGAELRGLVNNAGIAIAGPLEFVPIDELRHQLEVNVVGQVAVTQALLPALRRGRGRIVNVSSIGGRVALPMAGPYAASKFALEGLSDSLRREVRRHGVEVILIEPGGIKTPIWEKGGAKAAELRAGMPEEADRLYGDLIRAVTAESERIATERGLPPSAVAEVVGEALTARRPRTRYVIGRDAKVRAALARVLPARALDRLIGRALSG
jgi:NAD(P)-dependent dehydrogenase (short-subunit alcohol dehydrogenase family)